jgi:hypothetical protein
MHCRSASLFSGKTVFQVLPDYFFTVSKDSEKRPAEKIGKSERIFPGKTGDLVQS